MKDLKSIDYMRQEIRYKNLLMPFWKFYKEKSIEVIENGGWHFNSLLSPEEISQKLKTFAHSEYSEKKYSSVVSIKQKIRNKIDLFDRGHKYEKVQINSTFPEYLTRNISKFSHLIEN